MLRLRFVVDCEVTMANKPDWMRSLEEKQAQNNLMLESAAQNEASARRILSIGAPQLWNRLASYLVNAAHNCQLEGVQIFVDGEPKRNYVDIQINASSTYRGRPDGIQVRFDAEGYRILCIPHLHGSTESFIFQVDSGRVVIRDEKGELFKDDEEASSIERLSRRILEPIFARYV